MRTIRNDYCIRMFTDSGNNMSPAFNQVGLQDGYLYATNAHIVGKINADLCVKKYKEVEKFPNAESIISEHNSIEKKTVKVDVLFNDLMKIECCFKPKMIDCEQCEGTGTDTCYHCNSDHDCHDCKGEGEIAGKELELTSEHDCELFGKKYKLNYLDLIIRTAVFIGVEEIEISNAKDFAGTLFIVGDFTILLMPCYTD